MGRRVWIVVFGLLFSLAAVAVLCAPLGNKLLLREMQKREVLQYHQSLGSMDGDWLRRHRALAGWYNYTLETDPESEELQQLYGYIGSPDTFAMGWVEAPELYWKVPLYHGETGSVPGARHDPSSSFPLDCGGIQSVLVLDESDILSRLRPGMIINVGFLGETRMLQVLPPETAGTVVMKAEGTGLEVHCAAPDGLSYREDADNRLWLWGAPGAWGLSIVSGMLGHALIRRKKEKRKAIKRKEYREKRIAP